MQRGHSGGGGVGQRFLQRAVAVRAQQQAGGAQQGAQDAGTQHGTPNNAGGSQNDGGVTDVEFEEVK